MAGVQALVPARPGPSSAYKKASRQGSEMNTRSARIWLNDIFWHPRLFRFSIAWFY